MTCQLVALCFDAQDPLRLGRFWADLLHWEVSDDSEDGVVLLPTDDTGFRFRLRPAVRQKTGQNDIHLHLTSSSLEDQEQTVARSLGLGAAHLDIGQRPEEGHVVLADPEGNEYCVIEPGNNYLADCGFFAEVACEGSRQVGYFWGAALGWPLVWDQDEETAIRSPHGGPKLAWGGQPPAPRTEKYWMHFDLAPPPDGDQQAEVDRLIALGATHADCGHGEAGAVGLADLDGHEFCVLTPR